ncbi:MULTISPECIES: lysozyme inhibitor LprI family protein [Alkalimonas]|uniref:Lysozyme inhibitor LprI family protein n=1 Tax=Alkalimonas mucilaginosa TaxID=3057676 RepID=A0ABU7JB58_9GAMM|nr:lysozyme inhibitor LprI family protein [Alkalimonas sp. MEB004]MEE2022924.1 lysozyme inhibitor LprI family protein [Alkalimonas sp. MEB004]
MNMLSVTLLSVSLHTAAIEELCPWPESGSQQQRYQQQLSCYDQELVKSRRTLAQWEQHHEFVLQQHRQRTGRPAAYNSFKSSQQSFQQLKEQQCRWQYQLQLPDVQLGAALYKRCQLQLIKQRAEQLEALVAQ